MTTAEYFDDIDLALALRPPSSGPAWFYDKCHWCSHDWHGLKCGACKCESTMIPRDETWRPALTASDQDQARRVMHETGCDGWTAMRCVGPSYPGRGTPLVLRSKLYGQLSS